MYRHTGGQLIRCMVKHCWLYAVYVLERDREMHHGCMYAVYVEDPVVGL
jgi:hypothetical protein